MKKLKTILAGTTAIAALITTPALAAPPPPAPSTWAGFYAGGNIGYSWGKGHSSYSEPGLGDPSVFSGSQNIDGVIGGPEIGYNWQVTPTAVLGLETDFQWSGEKGGNSFGACYFDCEGVLNGALNSNISWFGTVRARAGIVTRNTFAYLTGGLAYGEIGTSGSFNSTVRGSPNGAWSFNDSTTRVGGTVGGGIEGILPSVTNWTWKIEYLFIDFGTVSGTGYNAAFDEPFSWSTKVTDHILRIGLNHKFH